MTMRRLKQDAVVVVSAKKPVTAVAEKGVTAPVETTVATAS